MKELKPIITNVFCVYCDSTELKQDYSWLSKDKHPDKYLSNLKKLKEIDTHYFCNSCGGEFLL